jgi:hypothetical protein
VTRRDARAELIRTLDEKYLANSVVFDAMVGGAAFTVDGTRLRDAHGAIDMAAIRARFEWASWRVREMRQRLVPTPLRLTTPAWIPVTELDIEHHVILHPTIEPDDPDRVEVLTGRLSGAMDLARPLWEFRIVELDSGRVAIVGRYHHVIGDALFGFRIADVVAGTEPSSSVPQVTDEERAAIGVPPRTGFGILAIAWRDWWGQREGVGDAWHEYWRKPFGARLRRWGGRLIRTPRNTWIARSGMAERMRAKRHSRYLELELQPASRLARRLGGSLHDLSAAAALRAVAQLDPDRDTVSLLVPISRRRGADDIRNHVSMAKLTVPTSAPLEQLVPAVREQVSAAVSGPWKIDVGARDWRGYATTVPWGRRPRYFGDAPVELLTGWPAGDPRDDVAVLACPYATGLTISVTTRTSTDIDAIMASIAASFAMSEHEPAPSAVAGG